MMWTIPFHLKFCSPYKSSKRIFEILKSDLTLARKLFAVPMEEVRDDLQDNSLALMDNSHKNFDPLFYKFEEKA